MWRPGARVTVIEPNKQYTEYRSVSVLFDANWLHVDRGPRKDGRRRVTSFPTTAVMSVEFALPPDAGVLTPEEAFPGQ